MMWKKSFSKKVIDGYFWEIKKPHSSIIRGVKVTPSWDQTRYYIRESGYWEEITKEEMDKLNYKYQDSKKVILNG